MHTIGILLPRSSFYEGMGFDMFEGLRQGLKHLGGDDIKIVSQNVGYGTEKQEVYRAAEQLLLQESVSIVFAYISHRTAQILRPLFMAANRLLIVLDAGANLPQEWPTSPNVFYHSLNNSLGAWMLAKLAVKDGFSNAGSVSGFYDGGYLHTYALAQSWINQGRSIVFNHATGYKPEEFTMLPLQKYLNEYSESCLFALFSSDFAQWFFRDTKHLFSNTNLHVYVPPFALEESMLSIVDCPDFVIKGIATWSIHLKTKENQTFVDSIQKAGREANFFSLLGWEASFLAIQLLSLISQEDSNMVNVGKKLKTFEFVGPRGRVFFHQDTNTTLASLYEISIVKNDAGKCNLQIDKELNSLVAEYEQMIAQPLNGTVSGWHNSYTCM